MEEIFIQFAIVLIVAFLVSYLVRAFKQPIIIGYILAGAFVAFILELGYFDIAASQGIINTFSKFGIAFLLFIVGLHLNPKVIKEIGISSLLIGLSQIIITFVLGFFVSSIFLEFNFITSVYIGIAMAFSSTIIVMKLFSDKKHLE